MEFDVIGQSFYPWWHGSLLDLRENLIFMANRYEKDIVLVEVAYCWRPTEYRDRPGPIPETPEGQRGFLDAEAPPATLRFQVPGSLLEASTAEEANAAVAVNRVDPGVGSTYPARIAKMAITARSPMRVKPRSLGVASWRLAG